MSGLASRARSQSQPQPQPQPQLQLQPRSSERREELLVARALGGLDPEEAAELAAELGGSDDRSFDLAVAAIDLAHIPEPPEPLPDTLATRVHDSALAGSGVPWR